MNKYREEMDNVALDESAKKRLAENLARRQAAETRQKRRLPKFLTVGAPLLATVLVFLLVLPLLLPTATDNTAVKESNDAANVAPNGNASVTPDGTLQPLTPAKGLNDTYLRDDFSLTVTDLTVDKVDEKTVRFTIAVSADTEDEEVKQWTEDICGYLFLRKENLSLLLTKQILSDGTLSFTLETDDATKFARLIVSDKGTDVFFLLCPQGKDQTTADGADADDPVFKIPLAYETKTF